MNYFNNFVIILNLRIVFIFKFDDLSRPNVELDKPATPSQTKQKFEEKFEGGWCMCSQDNRLLNSCLTLKKTLNASKKTF